MMKDLKESVMRKDSEGGMVDGIRETFKSEFAQPAKPQEPAIVTVEGDFGERLVACLKAGADAIAPDGDGAEAYAALMDELLDRVNLRGAKEIFAAYSTR